MVTYHAYLEFGYGGLAFCSDSTASTMTSPLTMQGSVHWLATPYKAEVMPLVFLPNPLPQRHSFCSV